MRLDLTLSKVATVSTAATAAPVQGNRAVAHGRDFVASSSAAIEGVLTSPSIAYKNSGSLLNEKGGQWFAEQEGNYTAPKGLVPAEASQGFAELLATSVVNDDWPQSAVGMGEASLQIWRSRAIEIYEMNSRIIGEELEPRGSSLNLRL